MRFNDFRFLKKWLLPILFVFVILTLVFSGIIATSGSKKESQDLELPESIFIETNQMIKVYDTKNDELLDMYLEEYLIHVTAAEMPASYEQEALKAQVIAARTFAINKKQGAGCSSADGAHVCTSSGHCQAFNTIAQMKDKWGEDFDKYYDKIKQAVIDTKGEIILYEGEPIEVLYHSSSGGVTENSENVFLSSRPYLKSVVSEGEESFSKFYDEKKFTAIEFISKLENYLEEIDIDSARLGEEIGALKRFESGRVESIKVSGFSFSGKEIRSIFGLNSTNFKLTVNADNVIFNTIGFGHGVGMSQVGADAMAKKGADYEEILKHYYQDIDIGNIN